MVSSNLHAYFLTWNLGGFKKYLDGAEPVIDPTGNCGHPGGGGGGGGGSGGGKSKGDKASSAPKSWTLHGLSLNHGPKSKPDPNERDAFGRTVLHLICSCPQDPRSFDFLYALLSLPTINVNVQDAESGWTALHRAMWCGNLRAAKELLSRSDTDLGIKDAEGLTAMDLYNSTCEGTNPDVDARGTDLFTWGSNKNCTLGLGDPADRALPERVNLLTQAQANSRNDYTPRRAARALAAAQDPSESEPLDGQRGQKYETSKFDQVGVNQVVFSKFHTGVVTSEASGNLSLCGFGGNARLGKPVHTQYALLPQTEIPHRIVSIALAQDHTLALTSNGFVMSWGQNRFSQLGYVIESPDKESSHKAFSSTMGGDDIVQNTPKRILGPLKKENVVGVAASRMGSACWTVDSVWTWGTNSGQLGYDKLANPVQVLPRKVTGITQPLRDLAMTDYAMACLLNTYEVLVYYADVYIRVNFPTQRFPSDIPVYRPPQFVAKPNITKITSCGATFAALSSLGDVFSFSLQNPIDAEVARDPRDKHIIIRPQMVWALRKRFTAVKDVALGSDGTVIICTHSGHVYIRQRANKQWSFKRTPYLQRVIKVAANENGSFAAVRSDAVPAPVIVTGKTLGEDLLDVLPVFRQASELAVSHSVDVKQTTLDEDEEEADHDIQRDGRIAVQMALAILKWNSNFEQLSLGSNAWLEIGNKRIPVHRFLLEARVPALRHLIAGQANDSVSRFFTVKHTSQGLRLISQGLSLFTALLWLQWIYSDEVAPVWDSRVQAVLRHALPILKVDVGQIKRELQNLAAALDLEILAGPLASVSKVKIAPTLSGHLNAFWLDSQTADKWSTGHCDIVLQLADRNVFCSSIVLRARCGFFDAMFDDPEWTSLRHNEDGHGRVVISLHNHKWRSMRMVLQYMHDGKEDEIFDYRHQDTLDEFLDFVFEVIAVANELLMDRLVLVCSLVIRRHVNILNASSLASEATLHNANSLKRSIFSYIACNLETMLENGMLDDMDIRVLNDLTSFVQDRQAIRLPITRSRILEELAVERQGEWLALQDLPVVGIRPNRPIWKARSPRLSPIVIESKSKGKAKAVPTTPLSAPVSRHKGGGDDNEIFSMDEEPGSDTFSLPAAVLGQSSPAAASLQSATSPWKSKGAEGKKVDMRSIIAEAETTRERKPSLPSGSKPGLYTPPMLSSTPPRSTLPNLTPSISSTGWRTSAPQLVTPIRPGATSAFPALGATPRSSTAPRPSLLAQSRTISPGPGTATASGSRRPPGPTSTPSKTASTPEVIIPRRVTCERKKTTEPAWSTAPVFQPAPAVPTLSPSPGNQMSLLDIQRQELDIQRAGSSRLAPTSLVDIQAEESRVDAERVERLEFERWWKQEEQRVKEEQRREKGGVIPRGGKRKRGGGRGRGGHKAE